MIESRTRTNDSALPQGETDGIGESARSEAGRQETSAEARLPDGTEHGGRASRSMPIEQRLGPRVAAYIPVRLSLRGRPEALLARSRDIGAGGVCVATPRAFPPAEIESVSIEFPGRTLTIRAQGCWQRRVEDEDAVLSGIQFVETGRETRRALSQVVQNRALELATFIDDTAALPGLNLNDGIELAMLSRLRQVPANRIVYREGERQSESLFIVFRGAVLIHGPRRGGCDIHLTQGSSFGGLSLISDLPSVDSCRTTEDTQLLEIDLYAYRYLESDKPRLARRIMRLILSSKLARPPDAGPGIEAIRPPTEPSEPPGCRSEEAGDPSRLASIRSSGSGDPC